MLPADSGGSSYDSYTQRALLALVGSASAPSVDGMITTWQTAGRAAGQVADLVEARLQRLTAADGGWLGPGADSFAATVQADLIRPLRAFASSTAGADGGGGYAAGLTPIRDAVEHSQTTASNSPIPWDSDTSWRVDQKSVDPGLFDPSAPLAPSALKNQQAKADAPYQIKTGSGRVVREVGKTEWETLEQSVPAGPPAAIFAQTGTPVSGAVNRFDELMEGVGLGATPKTAVHAAVLTVNGKLAAYAPTPQRSYRPRSGSYATAGSVGAGGGASTPSGSAAPAGIPDAGALGGASVPRTAGHPNFSCLGHLPAAHSVPLAASVHDRIGLEPTTSAAGLPSSAVSAGGPGSAATLASHTHATVATGHASAGLTDPTLPLRLAGADAGGSGADGENAKAGTLGTYANGPSLDGLPAGSELPATAAAGAAGIGAPPAALEAAGEPGGLGALTEPVAPGSIGSLASGAILGAGAPGTSFTLTPSGHGSVNLGSVGPVAGRGVSPGGSPSAGATEVGTSGPTGGVLPVAPRRARDSEDPSPELDGTWLEEDLGVWGSRAAAPPAEIR